MIDEKVDFETAILAQSKGFKEQGEDFYTTKRELCAHMFNFSDSYMCEAPNQSLLQRWLREVHNIDVQPYLIRTQLNGDDLYQSKDKKEYSFQILERGVLQFVKTKDNLSYEEALEEGLLEGLKLIK